MDDGTERFAGCLAEGETILWSGRGTLARTAWWRRWDLVVGLALLSLATDVPPLLSAFHLAFDVGAEALTGVRPAAVVDPDPLAAAAGDLLDLVLASVGVAYLLRFVGVLDHHGRAHHAVTDRRALRARGRTLTSVPLSSIASFSFDEGERGGGVAIRQAGSRRRIVMAGLDDAEAAALALANAIGRR